ncbi:MAG: glycogen/starch/alpha-glucan phosphorylase [Gammaproteobacteria bacterium]|nr:glycogen/starch/alpha-glucan phosphorylase [Gammaproteobacteria bacterium]
MSVESVYELQGSASPDGEPVRTGHGVEALKRAFLDNLFYIQARFPEVASPRDYYHALACTVRDRLLHRWIRTARAYKDRHSRTVCYLSAEFLLGPQLENNLINLDIGANVGRAMRDLGMDLDLLVRQEEEPGLGNGGLGRLAACYMDSMATLCLPAIGYGIRYEFGIFDQEIRDGCQVEIADRWLRYGNPWEIPRPEITFNIMLGGHTEQQVEHDGRLRVIWVPGRIVRGVAYDTPILGYGVDNANLLRLFKSEAPEAFDFQAFNYGDYYGAVEDQIAAENLTKVLYPNDEPVAGKRLRLEQQYFFASCALQDMIRIYQQSGRPLADLAAKYVVQLNDTHPAIAVAELMRLLVDEHGMGWDEAWDITRHTFAYTNHTLLPEALEKWPLDLFARTLPRHMEIVFEINRRFLDEVRIRFPRDDERLGRLSLIDEHDKRYVRMAHLACVGSFAVNGVARMHTELLQRDVLADFHALWPEKFSNKTNGVTPRRFLRLANPPLAELITGVVGPGWERDLERLRGLEQVAGDTGFQDGWRRAKRTAKERLAALVRERTCTVIDPATMFDVQVKRIHEYKRQHLNVLRIVSCYNRLKAGLDGDMPPRTFLFGGKAAPGYFMAKLIIRLITGVAATLEADRQIRDRLRVVFVPDLNVRTGHYIYPAADLSEQISLAGKEASGTGNMKLALNGALTIGTLDGANVEIREEVGAENFFLFGHTVEEVARIRALGYRPWELYQRDQGLRDALDLVDSGFFARGDRTLFRPLVEALKSHDEYLVLADFAAYLDKQDEVGHAWRDEAHWTRMSVLNVARMGRFSSDRAVLEYAREIWRIEPVPIATASA